MSVEHTLAMIDGALDDHISGDAMRWQPPDDYDEPVVLPPARLGGTRILTDRLGWDGYAATAALAPYGPAAHADLEALTAAWRTMAEAFRPYAEALARALAQIAADLRAGLHAEVERRQRDAARKLREQAPGRLSRVTISGDGLPPAHAEQLAAVEAQLAHHEQQGGHPFAVRPECSRRR